MSSLTGSRTSVGRQRAARAHPRSALGSCCVRGARLVALRSLRDVCRGDVLGRGQRGHARTGRGEVGGSGGLGITGNSLFYKVVKSYKHNLLYSFKEVIDN